MRGMILAAGLGSRMQALTQSTPKPLLRVHDRYLIEYAIYQLTKAGITDIVINVSYKAEMIQKALGTGDRYGANFIYSYEKERLETGGGILHALPLLRVDKEQDRFIVVSSDVITDYPLQQLQTQAQTHSLAHLVLVNNPAYHPAGDFGLTQAGYLGRNSEKQFTFANLATYQWRFFSSPHTDKVSHHFKLNQILFPAVEAGLVSGELYTGLWHNIGSPQELALATADMRIKTLSRSIPFP